MHTSLYILIVLLIFPLALLGNKRNFERDFGWIEYPLGLYVIIAMVYSLLFELITPLVIPVVIILMVITYLVKKWYRQRFMFNRLKDSESQK